MQDNKMQDNTIQDNTMQGNQDVFETVRKMGNDPENLEGCETVRKWEINWKSQTNLTLSGKREMIWKNPVSFDTVRKMGNYLEKYGQL